MASDFCESFDTNLILRLMVGDIPEQSLKVQDLLMRMNCVYNIADVAITEAVYVLQREHTRQEIVSMIRKVLELPNIRANFNLFERVFPMYLEHPKLSFNDCCLAVYAELNGAESLWTFDQKLAGQVGTAKMVE